MSKIITLQTRGNYSLQIKYEQLSAYGRIVPVFIIKECVDRYPIFGSGWKTLFETVYDKDALNMFDILTLTKS